MGDVDPLIDTASLAALLDDPRLVLLDASTRDNASPVRLPGARRFDIDGAMSDLSVDLPHGMPSAKQFQAEARALGVHRDSVVVVYDAVPLFSAARAWWMFKAMGHDAVAVLDGGLPLWQAQGRPTEPWPAEAGAPGAADDSRDRSEGGRQGDFVAAPRPGMLIDVPEVQEALAGDDVAVLDARSRGRFAGTDPEPRPGLRGGHMPGSANLPFTDLRPDGTMLPAAQLRTLFEEVGGGRERFVFSCGSGVTACVLALGATLAGYDDIRVYDGSWSQWGRPDSGLPVQSG